jgi:salicylate hydroxylase
MHLRGKSVAVVGAGIGGLAAALALGQRGARVTVFEQASRLAEVGAGIQVGPNGVAVLEALGLRDAAEAVAALPEGVVLADGLTGRDIARLPLGAVAAGRYGRPYWQMHRADLLAVLLGAMPEAGVRLRLDAHVARVEAQGEEPRVVLGEGSEAFEVVVGADGIRSSIRETLFDRAPARFTGHVAWRGLVPMTEGTPPPPVTRVHMGPGRHVVTYPLRQGRVMNVVAVEERASWAAEGWSHRDRPEAVREAFRAFAADVRALLDQLEEPFLWGLFDHRELPAWVAGRVALLGDACHPMLPFLAQGATMALEDAWVLAAQLDAAASPEAGLLAYEARRKGRATRVQRAAARNGALYHLRGPARRLAHAALAGVPAGLLMRRFDWLYGADVVSVEAIA